VSGALNPSAGKADQAFMASLPAPAPPERARARMQIGTPEQYRWLGGIVKWVLVLNLIDAVLTLLWVRFGFASEANTLMDELVNEHEFVFVAVKLGLVGMGSWVLWKRRDSGAAVVAIFAAFIAYYMILLYHLQYASGLIHSLFGF
jgi:hypothetical protein